MEIWGGLWDGPEEENGAYAELWNASGDLMLAATSPIYGGERSTLAPDETPLADRRAIAAATRWG